MVPSMNGFLENDIVLAEIPDKTYKMHLRDDRISGLCSGREAVKQAIYKILNTERYEYVIYSWNYGVQFSDLFGEPVSYVCPEIERRITDALIWDSRIQSCDSFVFDTSVRGVVRVSFTAHTIYGEMEIDTEVNV